MTRRGNISRYRVSVRLLLLFSLFFITTRSNIRIILTQPAETTHTLPGSLVPGVVVKYYNSATSRSTITS